MTGSTDARSREEMLCDVKFIESRGHDAGYNASTRLAADVRALLGGSADAKPQRCEHGQTGPHMHGIFPCRWQGADAKGDETTAPDEWVEAAAETMATADSLAWSLLAPDERACWLKWARALWPLVAVRVREAQAEALQAVRAATRVAVTSVDYRYDMGWRDAMLQIVRIADHSVAALRREVENR